MLCPLNKIPSPCNTHCRHCCPIAVLAATQRMCVCTAAMVVWSPPSGRASTPSCCRAVWCAARSLIDARISRIVCQTIAMCSSSSFSSLPVLYPSVVMAFVSSVFSAEHGIEKHMTPHFVSWPDFTWWTNTRTFIPTWIYCGPGKTTTATTAPSPRLVQTHILLIWYRLV